MAISVTIATSFTLTIKFTINIKTTPDIMTITAMKDNIITNIIKAVLL